MVDVGDLTLLSELTVDTVRDTIKERYHNDIIYTRCGEILISVNPFKDLTIYTPEYHDKYSEERPRADLEPHIFQVASTAFHKLKDTGKQQVVIISGESGAGKTENLKYMVTHLMRMSGDAQGDLHDRILQVNPLLEAFGNAKTVLNLNSSRFAKYLQLNFSKDGTVQGATVSDYMLEKSRVVHQGYREGNFQIFYAFLAGLTDTDRDMLSIRPQNTFRIVDLKSTILTSEDTDKFRKYMYILEGLGLTVGELNNVKGILAVILHLTNIQFYEDKDTEIMRVYDEIPLQLVTDILEVDENVLAKALVTKKIKVDDEDIDTIRTKAEAEGTRDSLAKALYERLFGWIVRKINDSLKQEENGQNSSGSIDVLDICGFEILETNSFEQMCINLVNEKIQNYMNKLIFQEERKIYQDEGLDLPVTDYSNNDNIIKMFLGHREILDLIDEDTNFRQATEKSLVQKLDGKYKAVEEFRVLPGETLHFRIRHFAGEVKYTVYKFLEKNRDSLSPELVQCMQKSKNDMVGDLFTVSKGNTGTISGTAFNYRACRQRAPLSKHHQNVNLTESIVAELRSSMRDRFGGVKSGDELQAGTSQTAIKYFKNSLKDLMNKMKNCEPAFVRCIKPNTAQRANEIDTEYVDAQLKYNGIAEVARIRREGWPVRRSYADFLNKFKLLVGNMLEDKTLSTPIKAAELILQSALIEPVHFRLGKKMIFMKEETLHELDTQLSVKREEEAERKRLEEEAKRKRVEEEAERKRQREEAERVRQREEAERVRQQVEAEEVRRQDEKIKKAKNVTFQSVTSMSIIAESTYTGNDDSSNGSIPSTSSSTMPGYSSRPQTPTHTAFGSLNGVRASTSPSFDTTNKVSRPNKKETYFWDIFRTVDTEVPRTDAYDQMTFKVLKVLTYGFLFLIFLGSCLSQRLGLMILIARLPDQETSKGQVKGRSTNYFYLALAMCIPYAFTSLWSFIKWLFGSHPTPGILTWIVVFTQEILHSVGLSLLVFWVLPQYNLMFGALVLSATCFLPSLLAIFCASEKVNGDSGPSLVLKKVMDTFAMLLQLSVIPLVLLWHVMTDNRPLHKDHNDTLNIVLVAVAFVCVSLTHWENFVDGKIEHLGTQGVPTSKNYNGVIMNKLLKVRYELQCGRYSVAILSGTLKIIVTFASVYVIMALKKGETNTKIHFDFDGIHIIIEEMFEFIAELHHKPLQFSAVLMLTIGGFVAYCVSTVACKLQMQIVSFTLPLLLVTPLTHGLLALDCYHLKELAGLDGDIECGCGDSYCSYFYLGVVWLLSLMLLNRHVWFPKQGRLEEYDSLFINPFYCGVLLPERLLLNRRRHNEPVVCQVEEKFKQNGDMQILEHFFIVNPNTAPDELVMGNQREDYDAMDDLPFIYACATMWHETKIEMTQLMKSIFRLDYDRHKREECAVIMGSSDTRDRYNFQAHIFFDDALELGEDDRIHANSFVRMLIEIMNDACSAVHQRYMEVHHPYKVITPYGCQLIWEMPGGCLLYVHVKDKNKIRHRKRWSQVMYMYYLLGYQLLKDSSKYVLSKFQESNHLSEEKISEMLSTDVQRKTKNTYILALDGDTDFSPGSVRVLLDRMSNEKVAAVCGRIHPIGSGPMVWYQMFEYAVGHWLQKATEHVLGCVLCSPGCFSLFRASCLMDNNVMKTYTTLPTEPSHFLQYDQGEDRWLCTLLLQQGYRVDYAAAADAYTYAPEGFNEFFNQRRRWTPSTLANILDLLSTSTATVSRNSNISYLYIMYQVAMMFGTVLGPGTVIMMIAGAIKTVFEIDLLWSYFISLILPTAYLVICFTASTKIQLLLGAVFSAIYSFIMMAVIAGTFRTATEQSALHPSVIFTVLLFGMFAFAGIIHWKEKNCLAFLLLYFLCIPSGYLLLVIYSLCNLNNVSWGTREVPKRKSKKELAAEKRAEAQKEKEKKKDGFFARMFFNSSYVKELKHMLENLKPKLSSDKSNGDRQMLMILQEMNENMAKLADTTVKTVFSHTQPDPVKNIAVLEDKPVKVEDIDLSEEDDEEEDKDSTDPDPYAGLHWAYDTTLGNGPVMELCENENDFWEKFIAKYLKPIDKDEQREKQIKDGLIELRNNACFAMIMVNALWIALNFMFQYTKAAAVNIDYKVDNVDQTLKISILGLLFIAFFTILIVIQFFGMLIHRYETFLHLLSMTKLRQSSQEKDELNKNREKDQVLTRLMGVIEPPVDYEEEESINRIEAVVTGGQTGRDLARSQRQDLAKTSRKLNERFNNLKTTLLTGSLAPNASGFAGIPPPGGTMRVKFNVDASPANALRNRYYRPALKPIVEGLPCAVTEPEPDYDENVYAEIRELMPTRMGRDFARHISRRKKAQAINGVESGNNDFIFETNVYARQ